jgi:DNA-directed RNA polymerase specialized sigma24 family protein
MSRLSVSRLASARDVILALVTYTDWWQPASTSVMQVGAARRGQASEDGLPAGLVGSLDVRTELTRRMQHISERERALLFHWYILQLPVSEVADALDVSRRHCFRLRNGAIRKLVELGEVAA